MRQLLLAVLIGIALSAAGAGQPNIQLKNRDIDTSEPVAEAVSKLAQRAAQSSDRIHLILQFRQNVGEQEANLLVERGGRLVAHISGDAVIASIPSGMPLEDLDLQWVGTLESRDKLSSLLDGESSAGLFVIELHSDVPAFVGRALILFAGGELHDNPDLAPHHLLARLSREQAEALALEDAVAYIFPANDELTQGAPILACASGLTEAGMVGQYTAKVGDGWDGPGQGTAAITYAFSKFTGQLPSASVRSEIAKAFLEWSRVAKITFTEGGGPSVKRNINILFGSRDHGDPYPFNGPSGVLAHTFYPAPPNPEPLAGDLHFDDDERWRIGADIDLYSVALHELGHALGLGHSDQPGAVMYPYYQRAGQLTAEDIAAVQALYAAAEGSAGSTPAVGLTLTISPLQASTASDSATITGSTTGGEGAVSVRWVSDRGRSGTVSNARNFTAAIPLSVGSNAITFTAVDSKDAQVVKTATIQRLGKAPNPVAVTLNIVSPGAGPVSTTASNLNVTGTATHPSGIRSVLWTNSRGGSGLAKGTASWDTGLLTLAEGLNTITIQAVALDNTSNVATLQVTYSRQQQKDTTAPTLTITTPSSTTMTTSATSIALQGSAVDNVGVTSVQWFSGTGVKGIANGTKVWTTQAVPLYVGLNTIIIRAFDAAGNMAWRSVQITRR